VLRPDGDYAIITGLEQSLTPAISGGAGILPAGSLLTLQTAPTTQPAGADFGFTGEVYPLLGTLQHPARNRPISFSGEYDPTTLTSGFTFSYPLATSGQPVRAGVLCQSLAGALHCGAHHLHSPRVIFAALARGQQTQESLATTTSARQAENISATAQLLAAATTARAEQSVKAQNLSTATQRTSGLGLATSPSLNIIIPSPSTLATPTPTTVTETAPAPSAQPQEPRQPAPGVFIYRGSGPSPTTAVTPSTP
jgi:hypothetical protein